MSLSLPKRDASVGTQSPTQLGGTVGVVEISRVPARALPFICWVLLGTGLNLSGPPFLPQNG